MFKIIANDDPGNTQGTVSYKKNNYVFSKCKSGPCWAKHLMKYKTCPKKNINQKNNVLAPNFNNQSTKMRYSQLVKSNGSHWSNNRMYLNKRNEILNSYNNNVKLKHVC